MDMSASDQILSRYFGQALLDVEFVGELKQALLGPASPHLREILAQAVAAGTYEAGRIPQLQELKKPALENSPHLFCSEAIERAAVASSLSGRLKDDPLGDPVFFMVWQICAHCMHSYTDFKPGFSAEDMDRIMRSLTLATEDIGASNVFMGVRKYLKPAEMIVRDVTVDPSRTALYSGLIERLERTQAATLQNKARFAAAQSAPSQQRVAAITEARKAERFFRDEDSDVLGEMRQAAAMSGQSNATKEKASRDEGIAERRVALLNSVSLLWRPLFEWLLDEPYTTKFDETLKGNTKMAVLARLDEVERGTILNDLARLRAEYPDWRGSRPVPAFERLDGLALRTGYQEIGSAGFTAWEKLGSVAFELVKQPVRLRDGEMARLLAVAQDWRPLCDFGLLDSAELTLRMGAAPQTIAALKALAIRPSHSVIPGNAGPEYEGDVWWNDAPPRIRSLLEHHGDHHGPNANGLSRFVGKLFGR